MQAGQKEKDIVGIAGVRDPLPGVVYPDAGRLRAYRDSGILGTVPLGQAFHEAALRSPGRMALIGCESGRRYTYGEIDTLSSDIFVVKESYYERNRPLLQRFLAGYRDSAAWMIARPEEAARIAVSRAINGRDEAVNLEIIKLRNLSSVSPVTEREGLGHFDIEAMQKGADTFRSLGLIARPLAMKAVVRSDLVPARDGAP